MSFSSEVTSHNIYGKLYLSRLNGDSVCFPLLKKITQFGRLQTSDVRIYDSSVSKIHAELVINAAHEAYPAKVVVHSANGIFLNGTHMSRAATSPISAGDIIDIAGRCFTYEAVRENCEAVVIRTPASAKARLPRLSLIRTAQIDTPTKSNPRRKSFLASLVTPFSLFSPTAKVPAEQPLQNDAAEGQAAAGAAEIDLMSWETAADDGRDIVQLDQQPVRSHDSDSDSSDEDEPDWRKSTPKKHDRHQSIRLTLTASPQGCLNLSKPITPAKVRSGDASSDEEVESALTSPRTSISEEVSEEERHADAVEPSFAPAFDSSMRLLVGQSSPKRAGDTPDTPTAQTGQSTRLPSSLSRKHSLREKVLIRNGIKVHNDRGKLQRSLSLGASPTNRTSITTRRPPMLHHSPASFPPAAVHQETEAQTEQFQPASYFSNHDTSSSSEDEEENEPAKSAPRTTSSTVVPLLFSSISSASLRNDTSEDQSSDDQSSPEMQAASSPEEKSLKEYFTASGSSSSDDEAVSNNKFSTPRSGSKNLTTTLTTRRVSPRLSGPEKQDGDHPKTPKSIKRKGRISALEALLAQQSLGTAVGDPQDISPRALRALRRSGEGVAPAEAEESVPEDLAEVRRELAAEAQGLTPPATITRSVSVDEIMVTPSKQRQGPRKSALKKSESTPDIGSLARSQTPMTLGKRKVQLDDSPQYREIASREDSLYQQEQDNMTFIGPGQKKRRISERLATEPAPAASAVSALCDSTTATETPNECLNVKVSPSPRRRSPTKRLQTPKSPGRARRVATNNPPIAVQKAFEEMRIAAEVAEPRTPAKPQRTPMRPTASPGRVLRSVSSNPDLKPSLQYLLASPAPKLNAFAFSPAKPFAQENQPVESLRHMLDQARTPQRLSVSLRAEHFGLSPVKEVPLNDAKTFEQAQNKPVATAVRAPSLEHFTPNLKGVREMFREPKADPRTPVMTGISRLFAEPEPDLFKPVLALKNTQIPAPRARRAVVADQTAALPVKALPQRRPARAVKQQKEDETNVFKAVSNSRATASVPKASRAATMAVENQAVTTGRLTRSKASMFPEAVGSKDLDLGRSRPTRGHQVSEKENNHPKMALPRRVVS